MSLKSLVIEHPYFGEKMWFCLVELVVLYFEWLRIEYVTVLFPWTIWIIDMQH